MENSKSPYKVKSLRKKLLWLLALIAACKVSSGIAFAVMIPLAFRWFASRKSDMTMFALLLASTVMTMNGNIMPIYGIALNIIQKILVLSLAAVVISSMGSVKKSNIVSPMLLLFPYLVFMAITAQFGWCPIISNFKMVLFVMIFLAFYGNALLCIGSIKNSSIQISIRESVLCIAIIFIFGSILLMPFPGISYMGSEDFIQQGLSQSGSTVLLFAGMARHSQTLGPTVAMLVVILFADWLFSVQKKDYLYLALMLSGVFVLYRTSSRTAMGSMLAGVFFILFFAAKVRGGKKQWRQKIVRALMLLGALFCIAFAAIPAGREKVTKFIVKDYTGEATIDKDLILSSRQSKLEFAMYNWRCSPIIGNGFQVSEDMKGIKITSIKDILSAPIEKSTWTYAILEEGGVIGLILFIVFLVGALSLLLSRRAYTGAAVLFTMVVTNFGEFGIFSMTNQGGLYWALTFCALIMDAARIKNAAQNKGASQIKEVHHENLLRRP